jgi:putative transposase
MTCMDAQHTRPVTYKLAYHVVWCPKYRKKILVGKLATFLEQEIRHICETNTWTIGALSVQEDHVHLFRSRASVRCTFTDRAYSKRDHRPQSVSTLP